LGLTIFVTLELEDLEVIQFMPLSTYKDYVIPYPKSYGPVQIAKRKNRLEHILWEKLHGQNHKTHD
jgi:hypothetical protein